MHRRQFLTGSLSLFATPLFASTSALRGFSSAAADLVAQSNVIDMLGLLTLDWALLERWRQSPSAFTNTDFQKLRSSGINVFHPAVALGKGELYEATSSWLQKWNRFIGWHPDKFLRVDRPEDLARARIALYPIHS